ncbi:transcription factor bHLH110-like isoform X2 [Tasmannia lanceolata]|uniref:transcription factor bHLH110-like isoform X2 n=1 Tax=Tasmannia lanceolata TaxID=3420 RepID=UPI0040644B5A
MNGGNVSPNVDGVFSSTRDLRQNHDILVPLTTSMFQDPEFQWANNGESYTNHSTHELPLTKIKEELSYSFPKFSNASNLEEFHLPSTRYIKNEQQYLQDLNEKLLHKTFSSGCQINGFHLSAGDLYSNPQSSDTFGSLATSGRGNFSRIHPSANISSPNPSSLQFSSLQALDLLASTKLGGSFSQTSLHNLDLFSEVMPLGLDILQKPNRETSNSPPRISFMNGVSETKRANGITEPKASEAPPKKPRFETRSSFPPFKVRKEKLGDRVAALQQLVAPFGKTDTASVLMEAIGYIKFLQDQVETLSVPYMKSFHNSTCRTNKGGSGEQGQDEEPKQDLRSRGLCLVPLSCTSYVTNDNGGVWSPPNFSGGT